MANFTKSIIRGAGNEIGRSIARTAINKVAKGSDANYVNVNGGSKPGPKGAREVVKAAKFEFSGSNRQSTIENKVFNLINTFEESINLSNVSYFMEDMKLIESKINDAYEFFSFREFETTKLDELKSKFFEACNQSIDVTKKYHSIQLENAKEELEDIKASKKYGFIFGVIGFIATYILSQYDIIPEGSLAGLPIIFTFFFTLAAFYQCFKGTSKIKESIAYHEKMSTINIKFA
jgi:hypothetical protein